MKQLIYDVGMHKGEDTFYYLQKGFNVIGFEADPELVKFCKKRFANEIKSGKVIIVDGAISETKGKVKFYQNKDISFWGTTSDDWAKRNELEGTKNNIIEVDSVDFKECLQKYGIPHYLKIDIEGSDLICLRALLDFKDKPDYISLESDKNSIRNIVTELSLLEQNGYDKFKVVNQRQIEQPEGFSFEEGATGMFGDDLAGEWINKKTTIHKYRKILLKRDNYCWYDTHASLGSRYPQQTISTF